MKKGISVLLNCEVGAQTGLGRSKSCTFVMVWNSGASHLSQSSKEREI